MKKTKRTFRFLPFIGLFTLLGALLIALNAPPPNFIRIGSYELIHRPLPEFSLPNIHADHPALTQAALTGEPAIINFFASWCTPCKAEHPLLMTLAQQGFPIIGIVWKDEASDIQHWLEKDGNPYRTIALDAQGSTAIAFGMQGVPETFVIDRNGVIVHRHIGPLTAHDVEKALIPLLERLRHAK